MPRGHRQQTRRAETGKTVSGQDLHVIDNREKRQEQQSMKLSARNQLTGVVTAVKSGAVMAEVTVEIQPGTITAAITDSSRERLALKEGDEVSVIIKATEVMIATQ
jgi:molybdopterin-binding protein